MRMISLFLLLTIVSAGCATPESRARYEAQKQLQQAQYMDSLKARCVQYGFSDGTDGMANCVRNEALADEARQKAHEQENARAMSRYACMNGVTWACDTPPPKPTQTDCTQDILGNLHCQTR